jgi:signal transduction histidine kinase
MLQQTEHREPLTQNYLSALRLFSEIEVKVKHTAPRLALIRDEMIQQRTRLQATRDQSIASIDRLKSQILAGLLGALGFAAVLVLAFLRDITGRLSTLVKNAEDIPNGKPLTRTVVGSDELSYLDQVLHSVTNKLNASAEYRKSMMSMVAHDLRAPILSSKLSLDLLTSKRPDATVESEVGTIDGIKGDLNHIIVLLEDMLAIEKLESGHLVLDKTVFDLSTLVDDCIRMLAGLAAAKSVSFDKKVPSLIVHADRLRIMQVLQNLLTNAIKNSESQTSVVITAEIERATVRVSVIDHGRGISPEDQKRIFDRFYTLDSKTGFGLGLAISKMILVEHGGEISVSSRVGSGSTFWFTLPYEEDEQVSP